MAEQLLLSLIACDRLVTYAVDPEVCTSLELTVRGPADDAGRVPTAVVARVEGTDGADASAARELAVVPAVGVGMTDGTNQPCARMRIASGGESVFALSSKALGPMTVHVRPATEGSRTYGLLGFASNTRVLIGRAEDAQLRYDSPYISGRHALLTLMGETFSVEDLGSSNGTFVNGERLAPNQARSLAVGDVVQVMDLVMMAGPRYLVTNEPAGCPRLACDLSLIHI